MNNAIIIYKVYIHIHESVSQLYQNKLSFQSDCGHTGIKVFHFMGAIIAFLFGTLFMWLDIGIARTVSSLEGEPSELCCLANWSCLNIFRLILCILTGISALLCILFEHILLHIASVIL